jgi:hypothetical protein
MKDIIDQLAGELGNTLLSDPICRSAIIEWANPPSAISVQELESTAMLEMIFGDWRPMAGS